ncbi:MAG: RecX family transcriptional regulator [Tatlockia sp.]|nr:RecX family transcriptional regulator [Tatlockia sp.]
MDFIIDAAIQYLSERSFSEKQLRDQLLNDFKGLSDLDSLMNLAIARLKKLELINDFRVAESLTQRFCHKGDSFIKQTLAQKGITEKIITKALASIGDESSRALEEARKKSQAFHSIQNETTKLTLRRFLTGRGFSFLAIQFVLRKLTQEENYVKTNFISQNWRKISLF